MDSLGVSECFVGEPCRRLSCPASTRDSASRVSVVSASTLTLRRLYPAPRRAAPEAPRSPPFARPGGRGSSRPWRFRAEFLPLAARRGLAKQGPASSSLPWSGSRWRCSARHVTSVDAFSRTPAARSTARASFQRPSRYDGRPIVQNPCERSRSPSRSRSPPRVPSNRFILAPERDVSDVEDEVGLCERVLGAGYFRLLDSAPAPLDHGVVAAAAEAPTRTS